MKSSINNPDQPAKEQTGQPASQSKVPSTKKTSLLILIAIVVLITLAGGVYLSGLRNIPNQQKQTVAHSNSNQKSSTSVVIPTNWKTYTNYKYGYQISVPSELHVYSHSHDFKGDKCVEDSDLADEVHITENRIDECGASIKSVVDISASGYLRKDFGTPIRNANPYTRQYTLNGDVIFEYDLINSIEEQVIHKNNSFIIDLAKSIDYQKVFSTFNFIPKDKLSKLPKPTPLPVTFVKRYYKITDKIIGFKEYPEEMRSVTDNQLVGLNCSDIYGSISNKIPQVDIDADPTLYQIMNAARDLSYYKTIQAVSYCSLEDSRVLVVLYNFPDEWKYVTANFGLLINGKLNMKVTSGVQGEAGAPGIGFQPLEYTKDDKFYYSRYSGDNVSEIQIDRVDLKTGELTGIQTCVDSYDVINGQPFCYQ